MVNKVIEFVFLYSARMQQKNIEFHIKNDL